jgi:hypothetical protein
MAQFCFPIPDKVYGFFSSDKKTWGKILKETLPPSLDFLP